MASVAGAVPFFARRENGDPGSTGCAQSESDEQRYQPSVRHNALRSESCGDARDRGSHGEGRIAFVFAGTRTNAAAGENKRNPSLTVRAAVAGISATFRS